MKVYKSEKKNVYLISDFYVAKNYQNRGYGTLLVQETIAFLTDKMALSIGTFIANKNAVSLKLFKKQGFIETDFEDKLFNVVPADNSCSFYNKKSEMFYNQHKD